jgi:hypothetical protein
LPSRCFAAAGSRAKFIDQPCARAM